MAATQTANYLCLLLALPHSIFTPVPKDLDCFFITIDLHARYTVSIPAETKEEAMRAAYNHSIPVSKLSDVEKDVVKVVRMTESGGRVQLMIEKC